VKQIAQFVVSAGSEKSIGNACENINDELKKARVKIFFFMILYLLKKPQRQMQCGFIIL